MCCGSSRAAHSQAVANSSARAVVGAALGRSPNYVAYFEYTGKTAMTVVGPVSGVRYRFPATGARLAVDLRDRASLAAVRGLVQVRAL
jgi:hypothetical protein